MSSRTVAPAGSSRLEQLRARAARHPHAALLVAVVVTLAKEPAVQAHPYTVPGAWQLASAVMFGLAIGLTAWLVVRAAAAPAEAAPA